MMAQNLQLWYAQPAADWMTQALPIGNGRMGGMVFGSLDSEHIQFNESSLWTGNEDDPGCYQNFGDLFVDLGHADAHHYTRTLALSDATHRVVYTHGGITYRREAFCSFPAQVLVLRLTANAPGAYTGAVRLSDAHDGPLAVKDNTLALTGTLSNGLNYAAQARVLLDGGTLQATHAGVQFTRADAVTVVLAAGTDYVPDAQQNWRGPHPRARVYEQLEAASQTPYSSLHAAHVADYDALFGRVSLHLGTAPEPDLPTDKRLHAAQNAPDPDLTALSFQYGRYLLIASSRDALPANLQGLWNDSNNPPWRCDYHSDINVQMNYWPACPTNLAECVAPLFDWVDAARDVHTRQTLAEFGTRGWTTRCENGIFGGSAWKWIVPGSAWLCQNLWDYFSYTHDRAYLQKLYPILKEVCALWQDRLKALPDGTLVAPDEYSPEHGPDAENGVSFAQQIVWDVFTNFLDAARVLDTDPALQTEIAALRERLLGPQIGSWGQLQEWAVDRDDPHNHHRHVSHLFGLYPGRQISVAETPELAQAATVSLAARGDHSTGWAMAWRICLWARLRDGNRAERLLQTLLRPVQADAVDYLAGGGTYPNLLDAHPPFQIDGNFGAVAGMVEMLLQSGSGQDGWHIELLPALPDGWPSGKVRGLCARGGFTVDMDWQDGSLIKASIFSAQGGTCAVTAHGGKPFAVCLATKPNTACDVKIKSTLA